MNWDYEVFPQTNTSRFLSAQMLFHIWIVWISLVCLILYLIQYGTIAAIAAGHENIHFVYKFDMGLVLTGFIVMIIYVAVISGIISLIAALVRKFRVYAVAVLIVVLGLAFADIVIDGNFFKLVSGFLAFEPSIILFVVKGVFLWLVLLTLTLVINKYTVYYRETARFSRGVSMAITAACIIFLLFVGMVWVDGSYDDTLETERGNNDYKYGEIVLDASNVPKGSKINIVSNISEPEDGDDGSIYYGGDRMYLNYNEDELSSFDGDKLFINYFLPSEMMSWYNMGPLATHVSARLDGTDLYVNCTYDQNVKAVFIPVYSFMRQFDYYKGKDVVNECYMSSSGGGSGSVNIEVE